MVPGFREAFALFEERVVLNRLSKGLFVNYGRCIAHLALHFGRLPHEISVEEINIYLYQKTVHENLCESYFKHTVFGMRFWFRLFGKDAYAIRLPIIKKDKKLPEVLSKEECRELFKAPRSLKHRFLLAFAYSAGLRLNQVRHVKISDVDTHRMQIRVRQGKGKKDRYVILSRFIKERLQKYLDECQPQLYLFEGQTPGDIMGERSIQWIINDALLKTSIKKKASMHTLRHSFATHLLEDGVDIYTIQHLPGHSQLKTTLIYLHVAQVIPKVGHSPLDTLYGF
ncbi:integrase [Bacteroidia bacterium]|nr:integrase [Bacteroidia bacterium]